MQNKVLVERSNGTIGAISETVLLKEVIVDGKTYYEPVGKVETDDWLAIRGAEIVECAGKVFLCSKSETGRISEIYSVNPQKHFGMHKDQNKIPETYYTIEEEDGRPVIVRHWGQKEISRQRL